MKLILCVGGHMHGQLVNMPEGSVLTTVPPKRWDDEGEFEQINYYVRIVGNGARSIRVLSRDAVGEINPWVLVDALSIAYGPMIGVMEHGR